MADEKERKELVDSLGLVMEDLNGVAYDINPAGEDLRSTVTRDPTVQYIFSSGFKDRKDSFINPVQVSKAVRVSWLNDSGKLVGFEQYEPAKGTIASFLMANYRHLRENKVADRNAAIIAYLRLHIVKQGWAGPHMLPEQHRCAVNDCVVSDAKYNAAYTAAEFKAAFSADVVRIAGEHLRLIPDMMCAVAYVFRARGHHYSAGYEELYQRVWDRTLHDRGSLVLDWKEISRAVFHAIYPDVLDHLWLVHAARRIISGSLIKRVDVAAAGQAPIMTTYVAVLDLVTIFPRLPEQIAMQVQALIKHRTAIANDRWRDSVNRHLYGGTASGFRESDVAGVAAAVRSMLIEHVPTSMMIKSPALARVAGNAPLTGLKYAEILDAQLRVLMNTGQVGGRLIEVPHIQIGENSIKLRVEEVVDEQPAPETKAAPVATVIAAAVLPNLANQLANWIRARTGKTVQVNNFASANAFKTAVGDLPDPLRDENKEYATAASEEAAKTVYDRVQARFADIESFETVDYVTAAARDGADAIYGIAHRAALSA